MKRGFTLVELVMAIVIAGIAVSSLISLFINTAAKNANLENISMAVYLAEGKLEEISSRSYENIYSEASVSFGGDFSDYSSQVVVHNVASSELNVSVDPTASGYKKISVYIASNSLISSVEIAGLVTDVSN